MVVNNSVNDYGTEESEPETPWSAYCSSGNSWHSAGPQTHLQASSGHSFFYHFKYHVENGSSKGLVEDDF